MPKTDKTYQQLQEELDNITLKLQSNDVDPDEAVRLYEQALATLSQLEEHIKTAKNKIKKLGAS